MMHHVRSEQARKRARNNSCKTSEVYSRAAAIQISRSPWKWWKDARFFKEGGRNPNSKHIWPIDHIYLCACVRTLGTWHVSIISLAQDFEHVLWQARFAGHTTQNQTLVWTPNGRRSHRRFAHAHPTQTAHEPPRRQVATQPHQAHNKPPGI